MLDHTSAEKFFTLIECTSYTDLKKSLYTAALRYANIRADWMMLSDKEKAENDFERTSAHNRFIDACDILSRNQAKTGEDNSWRKELGNDRKSIGDFACYIHMFISLKNR